MRRFWLTMLLCVTLVPCATAQTTEQENAVGHFTYSPYLTVLYSPGNLGTGFRWLTCYTVIYDDKYKSATI